MRGLSWIVAAIALLVVVGGAVFLATWQIPAPVATTEKVIPDDRLPR
jgi:hypothetical protein